MSSYTDCCCARFPRTALPQVAGLRCTPGVEAWLTAEHVWLRWPASREEVLRQVWPISGVELFVEREGSFYRLGEHLPFFDTPDWSAAKPLQDLLFPAPFTPAQVPTLPVSPVMVELVPEDKSRATTAMQCKLTDLHQCLSSITIFRLEKWLAARCGNKVLARGPDLPWLPDAQRFWGKHVLVPLGYRLSPNVPEAVLRAALAAEEDHLLVFYPDHVERIPLEAFQPLTRAAVRSAAV